MTNAMTPLPVRMRPVSSTADEFTASELLAQAMTDNLDAFEAIAPCDATYRAVEIAEDGSAVLFEVFVGTEWGLERSGVTPLARVIVHR